jgi:hypothetical protein
VLPKVSIWKEAPRSIESLKIARKKMAWRRNPPLSVGQTTSLLIGLVKLTDSVDQAVFFLATFSHSMEWGTSFQIDTFGSAGRNHFQESSED